jgi:tetratricopeptide (TPR) repeat protein
MMATRRTASSLQARAALIIIAILVSHAAWLYPQSRTANPIEQGKILAINGHVEHTAAQREQWNAAVLLQPLLAAERVRTLTASRASILFIDETQVKLNASAVLTVREIRRPGGPGTSIELERGEGWFRAKNPGGGLTIRTPSAAAAVRGTELNLRIGPAGETVLTVVEGSTELSNPQGSILVNGGEEGTAIPGQPPTKRVILNPEDAVQWALYYPAQVAWQDLPAAARAGLAGMGFERLRAGDIPGAGQIFASAPPTDDWSRIGNSMAYLSMGDADRARSSLAKPAATQDAEAERRAQLASVQLATGDVAGARSELESLLVQDPNALRAQVLLSSIELRQNRTEPARAAAERALRTHGESVGALIAASESAQSRFDLEAARRYLDRALAIDGRDVHALANRARIRFGTDDIRGAREDADRASAVAPDDATVRSLRGFINLADGKLSSARTDFEAAIKNDSELGEPHLGLGLLHFRQEQVEAGLVEMLTATLLEPHVALYQSYLGKAYYQARRFSEAFAVLSTAKRLDPRDPTPWLYSSLYLRDQNRQVDALNDLKQAIALNDFRAVYRSRLLLDRDLASKNVSLAEIYRQLGFEAWGAYEAANSLDADMTNASAHLFLSGTYGGLPDRLQALSSELLQYFLYAPVNRNSFNNFAEYTALLEQPERQLTLEGDTGTRRFAFGDIVSRTGNERLATAAFIEQGWRDGARTDRRDDRLQGFVQGKVALPKRTDMFFSLSRVRQNTGDTDNHTVLLGQGADLPIILQQFTTTDPRRTYIFKNLEATLGLKHEWRPGSVLTAAARRINIEQTNGLADSPNSLCVDLDLSQFGAVSNGAIRNNYRSLDFQIQEVERFGRHQFIAGYQSFGSHKDQLCSERLSVGSAYADFSFPGSGRDTASVMRLRHEIQVTRRIHATLGVEHQRISYRDITDERTTEVNETNPRAGISWRLAPTTVVRATWFKQLNTTSAGDLTGDSIAPSTIAGFVVARNEFPTTRRKEYDVALEHARSRLFFAVRAFNRDNVVPLLLENGVSLVPEADATNTGGSIYANWIAARRLTIFGDNQFVRVGAHVFDRYDNLTRLGLNVIHPAGIFFRLTGSYVTQRFTNTPATDLPRSSFMLADVDASWEFAHKRGRLELELTNAFNRAFSSVIETINTEPFFPHRRATLSFRWRLW